MIIFLIASIVVGTTSNHVGLGFNCSFDDVIAQSHRTSEIHRGNFSECVVVVSECEVCVGHRSMGCGCHVRDGSENSKGVKQRN